MEGFVASFFMVICFADLLRTIKDPEKPNTLEELNVVYEEGIFVSFKATEIKKVWLN